MKYFILFLLFFGSTHIQAQKSIKKLLNKYNDKSVPYITPQELKALNKDVFLLDSREPKEYHTSHLKHAIHVGYDEFKIDSIQKKIPNKNSEIIVYCSVGIRSESIGDSLKKAGYKNVKNLYGGIFEWKNNDLPVYNSVEKETDSIHTFSLKWSQWLKKGIKVYE
ncbi:rhodanese-like domain-containing protein [Flavivirga jejuensis]|uniref:Rhodanese-like domain-containing protein n=1 Tax=Flavivirga jejuensis TaxID=870487 RepID=A0ABT8WJD1_9FLAO|nr:rhodanese-like domain-containing protein [Flavivirga jejuensis]MDO5973218.1 rhodanese-like domain-containing protein [Flavivirga jejuensis]